MLFGFYISPRASLMGELKEKIEKPPVDRSISLRRTIMGEIKQAIPSVKKGTYLEKLNEEELKAREIERVKRAEELKIIEKALKEKQVR